jgi:hypothetical protein
MFGTFNDDSRLRHSADHYRRKALQDNNQAIYYLQLTGLLIYPNLAEILFAICTLVSF